MFRKQKQTLYIRTYITTRNCDFLWNKYSNYQCETLFWLVCFGRQFMYQVVSLDTNKYLVGFQKHAYTA